MKERWLVEQRWEQMLFAHWRIDQDVLAGQLPVGVEPDVHDGSAWIGLVAFVMRGTRGLGVGPLPDIPELNMRTYVRVGDVPGVWFLTLDASSRFFAGVGKALYGLDYHVSDMAATTERGRVHYLSCRRNARFAASYEPVGDAYRAGCGSLENALFERYRLFSQRRGSLVTAAVEHEPWRLRRADAEIGLNTMCPPGLRLDGDPVLHYSQGVAARISAPSRCRAVPGRMVMGREGLEPSTLGLRVPCSTS